MEQDYSFDILWPLQAEARRRGHEVRWLLLADANPQLLQPDDLICANAHEAIRWQPHAVFAPGDRLPSFIPGLKVLLFHGITADKRGNDGLDRGLFDLFCTTDLKRAERLQPLAEKCGYFRVAETGWTKLDALFNFQPTQSAYGRPQILFASTFTPSVSAAEALYPEIRRLSQSDQWQWLVTLHPKMAKETVARYRNMIGPNLEFFETERAIEAMHRANIMVSDNSSILQEFLFLKKPVITYRNRNPQPYMLNILETNELESAIPKALNPDENLRARIDAYGPSITPNLDGAASGRVLDAVTELLASGWRDKKPANLWRNIRMRRQLKYYKFW